MDGESGAGMSLLFADTLLTSGFARPHGRSCRPAKQEQGDQVHESCKQQDYRCDEGNTTVDMTVKC